MAKQPPETQYRFRIVCEVDQEQVGGVLADLTRRGITQIGHEMISDVVTFNRTGPRKVYDSKGKEFAKAYIADNPTFRINDLVKHFEANGRTSGAGYTAVRDLVREEFLTKLSPGHYQRADIKAIEPPAPREHDVHAAKKHKRLGGATQRYDVSNRDLILKHIGKRSKFTAGEITALFKQNKRPTNSASSQISQMTTAGILRKTGTDGEYEVVKH